MPAERWRSRWRTAKAAMMLTIAQLTVTVLPFKFWRNSLGHEGASPSKEAVAEASLLAAHIEWAAKLLPFATKCLPQAMALSWMLRRRRLTHIVVFAVRPAEARSSVDALHAWLEVNGAKVIGDLAGPWIETLRLGGMPQIRSMD